MIAVVMLLMGLSATAWAKPKIAVLGVEVVGTSDKDSVRVADELTTVLRARPKSGQGSYELAPGSEKALTDEKTRAKCESELPKCMAQIGTDLGADVLLYGKLERKPQGAAAGYQVTLRILDVPKKATATTWTEVLPLADATGAKLGDFATRGYKKLTGERN
jgi:hypothetical protein